MLADMSADEFDERLAWFLISGEGEHRQLVALLASIITNQASRQMAAGAGVPLRKEQMVQPADFLPQIFRDKREDDRRVYASEHGAAEQVARQLGLM